MSAIGPKDESARRGIAKGGEPTKTGPSVGHMNVAGEPRDVKQLPKQGDVKAKMDEPVDTKASIEEVMKDLPQPVIWQQQQVPPKLTPMGEVSPESVKMGPDFPFLGGGNTEYIKNFGSTYQFWYDDYNKEPMLKSIGDWGTRKKAEWSEGGAKSSLAGMMAEALEKWDVQGEDKKVIVDRNLLETWLETTANEAHRLEIEKSLFETEATQTRRSENNKNLSFIAFALKSNKGDAEEWLKAIKKESDEKRK